MKKIFRNQNVINYKKDLKKIKSLKKFPVFMGTSSQKKSRDLLADMNFYISKSSGIVQLNPILPFKTIYKKGHNSGLIGSLWKKHHSNFASFIKAYKPRSVLEIGGGHGILSKNYLNKKKIDWTIVEPNPSPVKGCKAKFIKAFFNKASIKKIKFDSIVHSHVLEHTFHPKNFFSLISKSLKPGEKMFFSVPNMQEMIKRYYANAMNFEHTLYLNEKIIEYFLKRFSFKIIKKKFFQKDHSIFYATQKVSKKSKIVFKNEFNRNKNLFKIFFDHFDAQVKVINNHLKKYPNKNIFLFGGHIFSQFLINNGLLEDKILFILDNDKSKHKKRLYGTKLKILSPNILSNYTKPLVVLRAGVYSKEIKKQIKTINNKAKFI